jgi:hypothetical protein
MAHHLVGNGYQKLESGISYILFISKILIFYFVHSEQYQNNACAYNNETL